MSGAARLVGAVAAAGVSAGAGAAAWGGLVERHWYALRHVTVPALAPGTAPLRILHLSDLHLLPWQRHRRRWVEGLAALAPDLVVLTGDTLGHPDAIDPAVATLAMLTRDAPGVAVLGSNDFTAPVPRNPLAYLTGPSSAAPPRGRRLDADRLVAGLEAADWHVLENARVTLKAGGHAVDVAGLGDPHIGRDRPEQVDWTDSPGGSALRLGVVHAPYRRALDTLADHGYGLLLAGHTHGGQLRVPGLGALVTNCDLPRHQARGLSRHGDSWLHVSAGLGHSMYAPVRFACRPEATLLTLIPPPPVV